MSENIVLSIETIHLEADKKKNNYCCESFKIFPEAKEKHGGFLFGIVEIQATPKDEAERIYNIILNTLKENYYQQVTSSPDPQKLNLEAIFEFALNKTNQKLTELIQIGQIRFILDNLHYFIGVIKPVKNEKICEIVFTNKGLVQANLIHKNTKNIHKTINILGGQDKTSNYNHDKIKIFSSITAGALPLNDTLIVSTEIFNNFLSNTQIQDVISSNSLIQAIDHFKTLIKHVKNDAATTFSALMFQYHISDSPANQPVSQKSINELIQNTEKTEKLLTPSFTLNIKKNITKSVHKLKKLTQKDKLTTNSSEKTKIQSKKILSTLKIIPQFFITIFKNIFLYITGKKKISVQNFKLFFINLPKNIFQKPTKNTIIALILIFVIITFTGSIFWTKSQKKKATEMQVYENQISNVQTLISEAESSFIYKNTNKSIQKLREATKELSYLPQSTNLQITNYNSFQKEINDLRNKILNIKKVVPQLITEIIINGNTANHSQLLFSNNRLYSFGSDIAIAEINTEDKNINQIFNTEGSLSLALSDDNSSFFIDEGGQIYRLAANQIASLGKISKPDSAYFYNNNIYALYKANDQINKYRFNGSGFDAPIAWIKNIGSANLSTAESLTIDGNIYVLNNNGKILKFYAGNSDSFNNPIIEPALESTQKIITNPELNSLYIFDPVAKRLIVMSKDGLIQKQLSFESLESIDDITLSNDASKGYILSNSKVYQFDL